MRKLLLTLLVLSCIITKGQFVTADQFRGSNFRGFNASRIETYSVLTGKNFPKARSFGANHLRVWMIVVHDQNNRYYFKYPTALKAIDSSLRVAEKTGLYVILTVEFYPKQGADDWWGNATRKANMAKFWRDSIVQRYKNREIIAAYDLMNEPRMNTNITYYDAVKKQNVRYVCTVKEYIEFQRDMINTIRAVDSSHAIVVEVLSNQMLGDLSIRKDSTVFKNTLLNIKNLIYSPHGYSPLGITHQGVSGTARRVYPESSGTYVANYFKNVTYWNEPAKFAAKWSKPIWVGEFACINWAPLNLQGIWTSTKWTEDVITYMESQKWSWAAHALEEYQGWNPRFPSSWYAANTTFTNAKPSSLPPPSARSDSTPTMKVLIVNLKKNTLYTTPK